TECSPWHSCGGGSRPSFEQGLFICIDPRMFVRLVAREEPPKESDSDSDQAREVENSLPSPVHHYPGGNGRGHGGNQSNSADSDSNTEASCISREPVGDGTIKGRQRHRFSNPQAEPYEDQRTDNSDKARERSGGDHGRQCRTDRPPKERSGEYHSDPPAIS